MTIVTGYLYVLYTGLTGLIGVKTMWSENTEVLKCLIRFRFYHLRYDNRMVKNMCGVDYIHSIKP